MKLDKDSIARSRRSTKSAIFRPAFIPQRWTKSTPASANCRSCAADNNAVKTTDYFRYVRTRPDRARILDEWIESAIDQPIREELQSDGRIRRWAYIPSEDKYLHVILLDDGETVHNAFFDRNFQP